MGLSFATANSCSALTTTGTCNMGGPTAHHELGASGAYRWLACHGSVAAQRGIVEKDSPYAAEGTCAHDLGEITLRFWKGEPGTTRETQEWSRKAEADGYDQKEMVRETEKYTEYVKDLAGGDPTRVEVETEVKFGDVIPGGFGTVDAQVVTLDELDEEVVAIDIADLKYGKGKTVYAEGNPQLRLYAYGTVLRLIEEELIDSVYDDLYAIPITLHICQPRLDHFDFERLTVGDVIDWAETVIAPAAKAIADGDETRNAGSHCDFCKAQATCKTRAEKVAADLDADFDDFVEEGPETPNAEDLTPEQLAKLYQHKKDVEKWFKAIEAHIYGEIEAGRTVPGLKLVQGNKNRKWVDESKALEAFKKQRALKQDEYAPRKLITPAAADKLLPEKSSIRDLIQEGNNRPMLVDESHKKPALVFGSIEDDLDDDLDDL